MDGGFKTRIKECRSRHRTVQVRQAVDYKIKINIEEEVSDSNPFGVLTIDYSSVFKSNSSPLYNASYESRKLSENQVKFEAAYYMDGVVINNLIPFEFDKYFYSSKNYPYI